MNKRKARGRAKPSKAKDGKLDKDKREKSQLVSYSHDDGTLAETIVTKDGYFQFAVLKGDKSVLASFLGDDKTIVYPAYSLKGLWEARAVKFPSGLAGYGSQAQLVEDITAFFQRYSNIPEEWLEPIVHYALMTWVYDRFTAVPYLRFLGEPGTGKTRLLLLLAAICYKALVASGNITGAALFRSIHLIKGTLIVDEGDFRNSEEWSDIIKVLNNGYTVGFPVIRCNKGEDFQPEAFTVYGPKIIGTRSRFSDHALETRCITLETKEAPLPKHIPYQLPPAFEDEARALRNKLLRWRFDNFARIGADESDMRHLEPRLGQIGASLCAVAGDEDIRCRLIGFLTDYSEAGKADSPKAVVVQALVKIRAAGSGSAKVGDIAREAGEMAREMDLDGMTSKRVGMILRSIGFLPKRTKRGFVVALDKAAVDALSARFAVKDG
jgi:hypothetical protein